MSISSHSFAFHNPPATSRQQSCENPRHETHDSSSFIRLQLTRIISPPPSHASRSLRFTSRGRPRVHAASGRSGPSACSPFSCTRRGREHFNRPLVEGPVVDHHLHGGTRQPPNALGPAVEQTTTSTRRTSDPARLLRGADPDERDVRAGRRSRSSAPGCGPSRRSSRPRHARPRRELGQAVEGLEMRLGEQRDHRNPLPFRAVPPAGDDRSW